MSKGLIRFTQILLYVGLIVIIALTIGLPWILKFYFRWTMDSMNQASWYRQFVLIFLYLLGIGGLWLNIELIRILKTVTMDPFIARNTTSLKRIAIVALTLSALFFVKCFLFFTPFTFLCGAILFTCSLLAFVLTNVFRQALLYKQEIDLTI